MSILFISIVFVGITLALMQIYANPEKIPQAFSAGLIYMGTSLAVALYLYTFNQDFRPILKWVHLLISMIFMLFGLLLTLINIYVLPEKGASEPVATPVFFLGSVAVIAGIIMSLRKKEN